MLTPVRVAGAVAASLVAVSAILTAGRASADAVRNQQMWVLDAVHAPAAWQVSRGKGVLVAVLDSGVDPSVSDLAGSVITGADFTGLHTPRSNPFWGVHGTWMASLIAGHGHAGGGSGILGIAPQARVLSVRVLADKGDPGFAELARERGNQAQRALADGIRYAVARHASVISMSLGNGAPSELVRAALALAIRRGVVVVASSGNSGGTATARRDHHAPYLFPADYPGVLGVAAVNRSGAPAGFSSANLSVQVAAPGVNVLAQGRGSRYWLVSGTSPACALTAGVAALIKAAYPGLSAGLVIQAITSTTSDRPPGGYDEQVGFGTVDAAAALVAAGRLSHDRPAGRGAAVSAHFGGGPAAVLPAPVGPRGTSALTLYVLLALASLALIVVSGVGLARSGARRTRHAPYPAVGPGP